MFMVRVTSARGLNGVILNLVLEGESRSQVQSTQEEGSYNNLGGTRNDQQGN